MFNGFLKRFFIFYMPPVNQSSTPTPTPMHTTTTHHHTHTLRWSTSQPINYPTTNQPIN
jgi:hypothetical protein